MSLYVDSAANTLTSASLDSYLKAYSINEPSKENGNGTIGLTPLALAARSGQFEAARLLLDKGAEVDALSTLHRTPLWIITSRGRGGSRAEVVNLLLKHGADAKYSHPNLHDGSTPLENELKQLKVARLYSYLESHNSLTRLSRILRSSSFSFRMVAKRRRPRN